MNTNGTVYMNCNFFLRYKAIITLHFPFRPSKYYSLTTLRIDTVSNAVFINTVLISNEPTELILCR